MVVCRIAAGPGGFNASSAFVSIPYAGFIGALTMMQRKNIVKQSRSKDVQIRPVPSTNFLKIVPEKPIQETRS